MADDLLKGSLHPILDLGELGIEKNVHFAGLQRCSDALFAIGYTVFLLHVWVVCFPHCLLLFDLTHTTNLIPRSLQCLIPALRRGKLMLMKVLDIEGKKSFEVVLGF